MNELDRILNNDLKTTKRQLYIQFVKEIWPKLESKYVVEPGAAEDLRLKIY